ncbi:MAG: gliding motility lipoprotein GldH [Bacteroidales bacterium]|jgi:gliding motility-associated lipoprotein GldH|nr:gliding motility lipoprotein GldH [Bacteroidales bacterium]
MNRLLLPFFLTGIVMLLISSCDKNKVVDNYKAIPIRGWERDSLVNFDFNVINTNRKYNLYLNVRNKTSYNYSNLWLFVDITEPGGNLKKDTVEITLAEPDGKWLGKGFDGLKTHVNIFKSSFTFDKPGVYNVKIQQSMRENNLKGINDIGFRVETTE